MPENVQDIGINSGAHVTNLQGRLNLEGMKQVNFVENIGIRLR